MIKWGVLIGVGVILSCIVVSREHWLAENTFLLAFVSHELIALMAVVLTVTLASVANLHLALNRMVREKFKGNPNIQNAADEVKKELRDNAWYIFWGFSITIVLLFVKGLNEDNSTTVAIVHALALWILTLYILCMYDIYQVVFGVVELDRGATENNPEDYSSDSAQP
ncbi:hypothetical protein [Pseudovibrio sp. Ad26]|uniref:hypothetical protein n=1 Tax=Pseudovibrio sp. Ad26 TaxID=989410 RepID=UPI0007AE60B6|nr:hypothetical protein [Pseudovibrio sp. Ad26]KZL05527.1 hypothetical protein PsAD26_04324 [Pseudovibrio sp. Ad26]